MLTRSKFAPTALALLLLFGSVATAAQQSPPMPRAPISGGILNGKAISKPAPAYPAVAKAARAQGTVVVQVVVDEEGRVVSAQAVSGHPLLRQAAQQAAEQARFSPTWLSGQPVKITGTITYNFVLRASARSDERGRLVSLFNLAENAGQCGLDSPTATIASVQLDGDNKMTGLVVRTKDGRELTVKLGVRLYRDLAAANIDKLGQLLSPNTKVRLRLRDCRESGGDLMAEDIHAAPTEAEPST